MKAKVVKSSPGVMSEFSYKGHDGWVHGFLSNGFIATDGTCVEIPYQAAKAKNPKDVKRILTCKKPFGLGGAKRLGRKIKYRDDWEEVKFQVMARLVTAKFLNHPELAKRLLETGDAKLIEGNTWHDNIWGNCTCGRPECSATGLNWLGQILMTVREALRQTRG